MKRSLEHARAGVETMHQRIAKRVGSRSWIIVAVTNKPDNSFAYTIGLHHKKLPELIVMGLEPVYASRIINSCAERMVEQGAPFVSGTAIEGITYHPLNVVDVSIPFKFKHSIQAHNHYGYWQCGLQQLVMADANGHSPWHGDCDGPMRKIQPLLDETNRQDSMAITVRATCLDSSDTAQFSCTVGTSVIESVPDCQAFVKTLLPIERNKWVYWEADLFDCQGINVGWSSSEI